MLIRDFPIKKSVYKNIGIRSRPNLKLQLPAPTSNEHKRLSRAHKTGLQEPHQNVWSTVQHFII